MKQDNTTPPEKRKNKLSASVDVRIIDSGTCGDSLTWTLSNDHVLTISGVGEMTNWTISNPAPWYRASITQVIILDRVTSIGNFAFRRCRDITNVVIPSSVKSIGVGAFNLCRRITNIAIPEGVTSIGNRAFLRCFSLTNVIIPDSVVSIGYNAFSSCISLTNIDVGAENTIYASLDGILFNKNRTEVICCPEGKAGECIIVNGVITIGDHAFSRCKSLTNVTIPDGVTTVGDYAFSDCESLTDVTIPDSVTTVGDYAFSDCKSLTNVTIPDGVTTVGDYAFSDCESLTNVTTPDSVITIGDHAFSDCKSLTNVTIPAGVTTISNHLFSGCDSLTDVMISACVISISKNAFGGCSSLTSITVERENIAYASLDGVLFNKNLTELVYYPEGKAGKYAIPDCVISIGDAAFSLCKSLTSVIVPERVTSIGDGAFDCCKSLTNITVNEENTVYASLDGVLFNKDQTELIRCPERREGEYIIPDSVIAIGHNAFSDCESLTNVTITDSVTSIGKSAFMDCKGLISVIISDSVATIGDYAFYGCDNLAAIYYAGSKNDWDEVRFGNENKPLRSATIHYNYASYNRLRVETGIFRAGKDIPCGLLSLRPNKRPKSSFDYYISQDPTFSKRSTHGEFITKAYIYIKEGEYLKLKTYDNRVAIIRKED